MLHFCTFFMFNLPIVIISSKFSGQWNVVLYMSKSHLNCQFFFLFMALGSPSVIRIWVSTWKIANKFVPSIVGLAFNYMDNEWLTIHYWIFTISLFCWILYFEYSLRQSEWPDSYQGNKTLMTCWIFFVKWKSYYQRAATLAFMTNSFYIHCMI